MKLKEDCWIAFIFLIVIFSSCSAVTVTVGDNGQVPEGSAAVLTCDYNRTLTSSIGIPIFQWNEMINGSPELISLYQNGVGAIQSPYSESGRYTVANDSILTITNIMQSDNGRIYQCEVSIIGDNPSAAQDSLTLSVAYFDSIIFEIISSPVIEGESVMFNCSVNANPDPEIILYKDETEIMRETATNLTYTIDNVMRSDAGNYTCEASNIAGSGTSQIETLVVYYIDTPMLAIMSSPVNEDGSVKFNCSVNAIPDPVIILYKDETVIKRGTTTSLTHTIDSVMRSDAGNYTCQANNIVGNVTSQTEQLVVDGYRSVIVHPATAKVGQNAEMTFTFTYPTEVVMYVTWFRCDAGLKMGDAIITSIMPVPNQKYNLSSNNDLIIYKVEEEDEGCYLCVVVTNTGNSAEGFGKLTVDDPLKIAAVALNVVGYLLVVVGVCLLIYICCKPNVYLPKEVSVPSGKVYTVRPKVTSYFPVNKHRRWTTDPTGIDDTDNVETFTFKVSEVVGTRYTITVTVSNCIGSTTKPVNITSVSGGGGGDGDDDGLDEGVIACGDDGGGSSKYASTAAISFIVVGGLLVVVGICILIISDDLSLGEIAAIVLGCIFVILGICVLIYVCCRGKRVHSSQKNDDESNPDMMELRAPNTGAVASGVKKKENSKKKPSTSPEDVKIKPEVKSDVKRYPAPGGEMYSQVDIKQKKKKPDSDNGSSKPAPVDSDLKRYPAPDGQMYAEVNKEQKKKNPDSDNGSSKPAPVDLNVEDLQYADLDLTRNCPAAGKQDVINHPDNETTYSSIQTHQM